MVEEGLVALAVTLRGIGQVELDKRATVTAAGHGVEHPVVGLDPLAATVRHRAFPEDVPGEGQDDVDGQAQAQCLLQEQEVGPRSCGADDDLRFSMLQQPAEPVPHHRHVLCGETSR